MEQTPAATTQPSQTTDLKQPGFDKEAIHSARPAWAKSFFDGKKEGAQTPVMPKTDTAPKADLKSAISTAVNGKAESARTQETADPVVTEGATEDDDTIEMEFIVDGKPVKERLNYEQVRLELQKAKGSDRRMQQAVQEIRRSRELMSLMKDPANLENVLKNLGYENPRGVMEEILYKQIQLENMDPHKREIMERDQKIADMTRQQQEFQKAQEQEKLSQEEQRWSGEYQRRIIDGLKKSGLPANETLVANVADYLIKGVELGKDFDIEKVLPLVKEDYSNMLRVVTHNADVNFLVEMLGEENLAKLREYELGRLAPKPKQFEVEKGVQQQSFEKRNPTRGMTIEEFRERADKFKRGELETIAK